MQVLEAVLADDEDEPARRDSLGTKAGFISVWFTAAALAGGLGYLGLKPEERPSLFDTISFFDGAEVNCSDVIARYEPDDEKALRIVGGEPAIYEGPGYPDYQGALEFQFRRVDEVVVGACSLYFKKHSEVAPGQLFVVDTTVVPLADRPPGSFRLEAAVTEIDRAVIAN